MKLSIYGSDIITRLRGRNRTLSGLSISRASFDRPEVLDALVDALLPRRGLHKLDFPFCAPPAPVPLALLLRGNGLRSPI